MRKKTTTTLHGRTGGLFKTIREIEKKYGKGSLIKFGDRSTDPGPCVSTGSVSLDCALGGRGLPYGRIVEIYGPESSGKTTLALHVLANVQKDKGVGAFIDAEHALDPKYASGLKVDIKGLYLSQPDYGEQALGIVRKLIISNAVKVIIIDSVAALVPKKELEGEMEDVDIALQARLMSKALRKISGLANRNGVLVIFINQERDKIGGFSRGGKTTPGGRALKFWASIRIEIRRIKTEKVKEKSISNMTFAKVVKSKICSPFNVGKFPIVFGKGIDRLQEVFNWAVIGKIIKKKGSTYTFNDLTAVGRRNFIKKIRTSIKERKRLIVQTREYIMSQFA